MAQAILQDSQLRLVYEVGVDENGEMQYKNKNYNNIKTAAATNDLFSVAQAIVGLQGYTLDSLERNDSSLLTV